MLALKDPGSIQSTFMSNISKGFLFESDGHWVVVNIIQKDWRIIMINVNMTAIFITFLVSYCPLHTDIMTAGIYIWNVNSEFSSQITTVPSLPSKIIMSFGAILIYNTDIMTAGIYIYLGCVKI